MEKLTLSQVTNGEWRVTRDGCSIFVILFLFVVFANSVFAQQEHPGAAVAVDSLHIPEHYRDSLLKVDSIEHALRLEEERRFEKTHQLATQRQLDLTNDGKPEVLRLSGYVPKYVDDTKLTFTIKSGKKTLFEDSWLAKGYFDTIDHLPDSIKLKRLRAIVTVFFANENFTVVDSNDFVEMMKLVNPDELQPHSKEAAELFQEPRVMYSVFHSREYWYGLIWDPKKNRFLKAWRN